MLKRKMIVSINSTIHATHTSDIEENSALSGTGSRKSKYQPGDVLFATQINGVSMERLNVFGSWGLLNYHSVTKLHLVIFTFCNIHCERCSERGTNTPQICEMTKSHDIDVTYAKTAFFSIICCSAHWHHRGLTM